MVKSTIDEFLADMDMGKWQRQLREIASPDVLVEMDRQIEAWDGTGVAVRLGYSHERGVHVTLDGCPLDGCPLPPRGQSW